jgi:Uma2 family endonuclease
VAKPAKRPATYEDLLQVPENLVAELVDGELYTSPRPASPHGRAASILGGRLIASFDDGGSGGPGGWWILDEPELHFGDDVLVPDIAGWRRERMPVLPNTPAFELPPDWVCEVISPSSRAHDRIRKMPVYARNEVAYAWLIDPLDQTLEVFRLDRGVWGAIASHQGEDTVRAEPFAEIEIPLSSLWLPTT